MHDSDSRDTIGRALTDAADPIHSAMPGVAAGSNGALATVADTAALPAAPESLTPYIDRHGFDPSDYRWVPVRRRPRADGFSEAKQRLFIEVLADTGSVDQAAFHVGISMQSCYRLRRSPGAEAFAAAWSAAIQQASYKLVDIAFDRAINGSDEPVFDRDGRRVGRRMKPSDRMLMFLLRAHQPERYRHAHLNIRQPNEPPVPEVLPLADAIALLEPETPPNPHLLDSPERLDIDIQVADICDGELPHWYRAEDREEDAPPESAFAKEFDRRLAEARGERGAP